VIRDEVRRENLEWRWYRREAASIVGFTEEEGQGQLRQGAQLGLF
jgi:hypothetical protein